MAVSTRTRRWGRITVGVLVAFMAACMLSYQPLPGVVVMLPELREPSLIEAVPVPINEPPFCC